MQTERVRVATPHPCTPEQLVDALAALVQPLIVRHPPARQHLAYDVAPRRDADVRPINEFALSRGSVASA